MSPWILATGPRARPARAPSRSGSALMSNEAIAMRAPSPRRVGTHRSPTNLTTRQPLPRSGRRQRLEPSTAARPRAVIGQRPLVSSARDRRTHRVVEITAATSPRLGVRQPSCESKRASSAMRTRLSSPSKWAATVSHRPGVAGVNHLGTKLSGRASAALGQRQRCRRFAAALVSDHPHADPKVSRAAMSRRTRRL